VTHPVLYLETTVVSYVVARPSRDVVVLAHQEITRQWWTARREAFSIYVSPVVLEEAALGDAEQARERLQLLDPYPVLSASDHVEQIAAAYLRELRLPERALRDAAHLAFACTYAVDYLLTWNCAHIANAEVRRQLARVNDRLGLVTPVICTPEELLGEEVE
jgi:predicted nucleic acid-binding protein